jgi:hypothetical protein
MLAGSEKPLQGSAAYCRKSSEMERGRDWGVAAEGAAGVAPPSCDDDVWNASAERAGAVEGEEGAELAAAPRRVARLLQGGREGNRGVAGRRQMVTHSEGLGVDQRL